MSFPVVPFRGNSLTPCFDAFDSNLCMPSARCCHRFRGAASAVAGILPPMRRNQTSFFCGEICNTKKWGCPNHLKTRKIKGAQILTQVPFLNKRAQQKTPLTQVPFFSKLSGTNYYKLCSFHSSVLVIKIKHKITFILNLAKIGHPFVSIAHQNRQHISCLFFQNCCSTSKVFFFVCALFRISHVAQ